MSALAARARAFKPPERLGKVSTNTVVTARAAAYIAETRRFQSMSWRRGCSITAGG